LGIVYLKQGENNMPKSKKTNRGPKYAVKTNDNKDPAYVDTTDNAYRTVPVRGPVEFSGIKEGHAMITPFGPHIVYSRMPNNIMKSINKYIDLKIKRGQTKKLDHGPHLVGKVTQEFRIDHNQIDKIAPFFNDVFGAYYQFHLQRRNQKLHPDAEINVFYNGAWVVRQFEGEYNPAHIHTECQLSCVGYLQVPDFSIEESKEKKKHFPSHGNIELIHEGSNMWHQGSIRIKPHVGDFIVFPSYLMHTVYPFKGDGERRSFSMNISVQEILRNAPSVPPESKVT
jgi:hypothetical protein